MSDPAGRFTTVAVFQVAEKAEVASAFLKSFGIEGLVQNTYMSMYIKWGEVLLQVPEHSVEDAKELLKQYFAEEGDSPLSGRLV